jgi:tetratricopeptide (TPR) repeat protein/DNA-binding winged helix-turn-helix (wHTH) protein
MATLSSSVIRCGSVEIDIARETVHRAGLEQGRLRQKSFQVLLYLIEHRSRVVSRGELFDAVWNGLAVTDDTLVQSIVEIRKALGDDPRSPRFVRTFPKSGYRFVGEIEDDLPIEFETVQRVEFDLVEDDGLVAAGRTRNRIAFAGAVVLAAAIVSAAVLVRGRMVNTPSQPSHPTVAVMFFEKQNGDAGLDWLREGLSDMLITGLSRSESVSVISRAELAELRRRHDTRAASMPVSEQLDIAREAKASRLITGTFTQFDGKIRIDAQLHDVTGGRVIGGESLVTTPSELLTRIDVLSSALAKRLAIPGAQPVALAQAMTNNVEAYRLYSLGVERAQAYHNREAIDLFGQAIALDPNFAMAYARIGYAYGVTWNLADRAKPYLDRALQLEGRLGQHDRMNVEAWRAICEQHFETALELLRAIIARYPNDAEAYLRAARVFQGEERLADAEALLRRGLAIDPNGPDLVNYLGGVLMNEGRTAEAIAAHEKYIAMRPAEANAHDSLGLDWEASGEYDKALAEYSRALELDPLFDLARVHLANTYYQLGRDREAIREFERYIDEAPSEVERQRGQESLAWVYRSRGEAAKAESVVGQMRSGGHAIRLMLALDRGDVDAARAVMASMEDSYRTSTTRGSRPNMRTRFALNGYEALKHGHPDDGLALLRRALTYQPPFWNLETFEDCLANGYLALGRYGDAAREYQRVLIRNPHDARSHYRLARVYEHLGRTADAEREYRSFLELWKDADRDLPEVADAVRTARLIPRSDGASRKRAL